MKLSSKADWKYLFSDKRALVYLVWGVLATAGFMATQYHQRQDVNYCWLVLIAIGMGFMFTVMPLNIAKFRWIFLGWLLPIVVGLIVSFMAFTQPSLGQLTGYLGAFWLAVLAVGYLINGLLDKPSTWYYIAVVLNVAGALACWKLNNFTVNQYMVAGDITAVSMLGLWLFRSFDA